MPWLGREPTEGEIAVARVAGVAATDERACKGSTDVSGAFDVFGGVEPRGGPAGQSVEVRAVTDSDVRRLTVEALGLFKLGNDVAVVLDEAFRGATAGVLRR